jgi:DNA (cytosine-5)-methyltransferase 3A
MKILSLFDGISIARQAITNCGIEIEKYYASEIDKYAIQIAQKNFPDTIQVGNVVDIKGEDFKDIDLIIGGSPCQDLSIAKKNREGLNGARSGLFYEYVRILKEVKPKYFILENVNSMPKEAKETITKELFGIEPIMINAALVSAQNRKRLFWVGKLVGDTYEQVKIELPEDEGILLKDILEEEVDEKYYVIGDWKVKKEPDNNNTNGAAVRKQVNGYRGIEIRKDQKSNALNTIENQKLVRIGQLNTGGQGDRIYSPDGKSVNLSANGGGRGAKTGLYAIQVKNQGKEIVKELNKAGALRARDWKGFDNYGSNAVMSDCKIRKLTPIECERLQSLQDNYTEGVSNTQRYKALGNGFNCKVIEHIIKNL